MKITMENQAFLKRLQGQGSCYSVGRWEEDFKKKEELMKNVMCERPFVLLDPPRGEPDPLRTSMSHIRASEEYNNSELL